MGDHLNSPPPDPPEVDCCKHKPHGHRRTREAGGRQGDFGPSRVTWGEMRVRVNRRGDQRKSIVGENRPDFVAQFSLSLKKNHMETMGEVSP